MHVIRSCHAGSSERVCVNEFGEQAGISFANKRPGNRGSLSVRIGIRRALSGTSPLPIQETRQAASPLMLHVDASQRAGRLGNPSNMRATGCH
jgi:hypothetical protein